MAAPSKKTPPAKKNSQDSSIKVSQSTIDSMKTMGMSKAISQANSGKASAEFVEGAKRMYGNRINVSSSPTVTKSASAPAPKSNTVNTVSRPSTPKEKANTAKLDYDASQARIKAMPKQGSQAKGKSKPFGKNESAM